MFGLSTPFFISKEVIAKICNITACDTCAMIHGVNIVRRVLVKKKLTLYGLLMALRSLGIQISYNTLKYAARTSSSSIRKDLLVGLQKVAGVGDGTMWRWLREDVKDNRNGNH